MAERLLGKIRSAGGSRNMDPGLWPSSAIRPSVQPTGLRVGVGAAALAIAGVGQSLLSSGGPERIGAGLLLLAAGVAALTWRARPSTHDYIRTPTRLRAVSRYRVSAALGALGLWAISCAASFLDPNAIFGIQGVAWCLAMALLFASCWGYAPAAQDRPRHAEDWGWNDLGFVAGLLGLSLVTHVALLQEIPWRFHFDEAYAYVETMRVYRGPMIPLFATTWQGTGLPSLWFVVPAALMHIVGPGLTGVRLGVALAGALTVVPVYGLGRLIWGRLAGALAAFMVTVSAVSVHYSRVSIINMTTALWWSACFFFLVRGLRTRRPVDFVCSGLLAGTSMYTYYATRLLPFLLVAFLGYLALVHRAIARSLLPHFLLMAIAFVVGFGPLLPYFVQHPLVWAGRGTSMLTVPAAVPLTPRDWIADWQALAPLLWKNFLGLSVVPGADTVYYAPFLLSPEAALLVVGTGILVAQWRRPEVFLVLLWGIGVIIVGGTLVNGLQIPDFAAWIPAFPALYLALALPAALWAQDVGRFLTKRWRLAGSGALCLALLSDAGANARAYVSDYPAHVPGDHSIEAVLGRSIEALPPHTHAWVVGNTWAWPVVGADVVEMMRPPSVTVNRLFNPGMELPDVEGERVNLAFLLFNDMYPYLSLLQSIYPGGSLHDLRTPDGTLVGRRFFVPQGAVKRDASARRFTGEGLAATIAPRPERHRLDLSLGATLLRPPRGSAPDMDPSARPLIPPDSVPGRARWETLLHTHTGQYTLALRTDGTARLSLDGRQVLGTCAQAAHVGAVTASAPLRLQAGWHRVDIDFVASGSGGGLEWLWTQPGGEPGIVPPGDLRVPRRHGGGVAWPRVPVRWTCT